MIKTPSKEERESIEQIFRTNNYHVATLVTWLNSSLDLNVSALIRSTDPHQTARLQGKAEAYTDLLEVIKQSQKS